MQENNPVVPQTPAPEAPAPAAVNKTSANLTVPLVLLLLLSLGGTGYLAYQNMQLQKQIAGTKTISYASPSPSASATPDPTANWKTYTDPKGFFTFKYPSDFTSSTDTGLLNDPTKSWIFDVQYGNSSKSAQDQVNSLCQVSNNTTQFCVITPGTQIPGSVQYINNTSHYSSMGTVVVHGNSLLFQIFLNARNPNQPVDNTIKNIYLQILSTFKFTQ